MKRLREPLTPTLAANIGRVRAFRRLTLEQLADRIAVDKQTLHRWERGGAKQVSTASLERCADALGVSLDTLRTMPLGASILTQDACGGGMPTSPPPPGDPGASPSVLPAPGGTDSGMPRPSDRDLDHAIREVDLYLRGGRDAEVIEKWRVMIEELRRRAGLASPTAGRPQAARSS